MDSFTEYVCELLIPVKNKRFLNIGKYRASKRNKDIICDRCADIDFPMENYYVGGTVTLHRTQVIFKICITCFKKFRQNYEIARKEYKEALYYAYQALVIAIGWNLAKVILWPVPQLPVFLEKGI